MWRDKGEKDSTKSPKCIRGILRVIINHWQSWALIKMPGWSDKIIKKGKPDVAFSEIGKEEFLLFVGGFESFIGSLKRLWWLKPDTHVKFSGTLTSYFLLANVLCILYSLGLYYSVAWTEIPQNFFSNCVNIS